MVARGSPSGLADQFIEEEQEKNSARNIAGVQGPFLVS